MVRFHWIISLIVFIGIPMMINSILNKPVNDIFVTIGSLRCQSEDGTYRENCNLCAIRFYTYISNNETLNVTIRSCLWFTNTFRQYIERRNCVGFTETNDIGVSDCDPMPYELVENVTLCICATDNCTENLDTCIQSVNEQGDTIKLDKIMADLPEVIQCDDSSDQSTECITSDSYPPKDESLCAEYVKNNSVFCTITRSSRENLGKSAFIYENYQNYLTGRLSDLQRVIALSTVLYTNTSISAKYPAPDDSPHTQCGCAYTSSCNEDLGTCFPSITETESSTKISVTITSEDTTNINVIDSGTSTFSFTSSGTSKDSSSTNVDTLATFIYTTDSTLTSTSSINSVTSSSSLSTGTDTSEISSSTNSLTSSSSSSADTSTSEISSSINSLTSSSSSSIDTTVPEDFSSTNSGIITNPSSRSTGTSEDSSSTDSSISISSSSTSIGTPLSSSLIDTTASEDSSSTNSVTFSSSSSTGGDISENSSSINSLTSSSSSSTNIDTSEGSLSTNAETLPTSSISSISILESSLPSNLSLSTESTTTVNTTQPNRSNTTVASSPTDTGISRGTITGIVVGSVLGGIFIIGIGIFACIHSGKFTLPVDRSAGYRI